VPSVFHPDVAKVVAKAVEAAARAAGDVADGADKLDAERGLQEIPASPVDAGSSL